jgi:hypothetical protein
MLQQLATKDGLDELSPFLLLAAVTDAVKDIQFGLTHLDRDERALALGTVFEVDTNGTRTKKDDVYYLNFKVETHGSVFQEAAEFTAKWAALSGSTLALWASPRPAEPGWIVENDLHHRELTAQTYVFRRAQSWTLPGQPSLVFACFGEGRFGVYL